MISKTFMVAFLGGMFCLVGCCTPREPQPALAVSLCFCGFSHGGRCATFQLNNDSGSISQYSGPYVEVESGNHWEGYAVANTALAGASKHGGRHERMEVPVPPGRLHWRAYVSCILYDERVQGQVLLRSPIIRNQPIAQPER